MPPRRRKAAAAAAAAAAADAAETRQLYSFASRFWEAQGSEVGIDPDERITYLLQAAKTILDEAGPPKHHLVNDLKERVGVSPAVKPGDLFVNSAQVEFETAARMLATEEDDCELSIGIPCGEFPVYHPHALLHLFAAVIGMLAPRMRVRIVGNVALHKRIMARLKTRQYVTLTETYRGAFDVAFDATDDNSSAAALNEAERSIERNNALLLYIGHNGCTLVGHIQCRLWLRCLMILRRKMKSDRVWDSWFNALFTLPQTESRSGTIAVLCELIPRAWPVVLNNWLGDILRVAPSAYASDEVDLRRAIIVAIGDGSNGIELGPALYKARLQGMGRTEAPIGYRERYMALAKAHNDTVAFQVNRATLIRATLHPPLPGVTLMAIAVVQLVVAYLDHPLTPVHTGWISEQPPTHHVGVKRKAPSSDTDTGVAAPVAAAAAAAAPASTNDDE